MRGLGGQGQDAASVGAGRIAGEQSVGGGGAAGGPTAMEKCSTALPPCITVSSRADSEALSRQSSRVSEAADARIQPTWLLPARTEMTPSHAPERRTTQNVCAEPKFVLSDTL